MVGSLQGEESKDTKSLKWKAHKISQAPQLNQGVREGENLLEDVGESGDGRFWLRKILW